MAQTRSTTSKLLKKEGSSSILKTNRSQAQNITGKLKSTTETRRRSIDKRYVPLDIVSEILRRLSAKCISRFKKVSQSWCDLIQDPAFIDAYLHQSVRNRKVLMGTFRTKMDDYWPTLFSIDEEGIATRLHRKVCFENFLSITSCNGLLAFSPSRRKEIRVYNPALEEAVLLPTPEFLVDTETLPLFFSWRSRIPPMLGFGFDSSTGKYKVVAWESVHHTEAAEIFTMGTKSWRKIMGPPKLSYEWKEFCDPSPVYASGASHWYRFTREILAFNFTDEEFGTIQVPEDILGDGLYEVGGRLCLPDVRIENSMVKIWVLTDYCKQNWVCQKINLPSTEIGRGLVSGLRDGEIFVMKENRTYLCRYNERGQVTKVIRVHGLPSTSFRNYRSLGESLLNLQDI